MKMKSNQTGAATLLGKIVLGVLVAIVAAGALYGVQRLRPAGIAASVPQVQGVVESSNQKQSTTVATVVQPLPSGTATTSGGCRITVVVLPWNATLGLMYANGGR